MCQCSSRISLVMDYTYHLVLCLRFLMALSSPVAYSLFFLTLSGGPPLFNLLEPMLKHCLLRSNVVYRHTHTYALGHLSSTGAVWSYRYIKHREEDINHQTVIMNNRYGTQFYCLTSDTHSGRVPIRSRIDTNL